jgi:hypothetical protein
LLDDAATEISIDASPRPLDDLAQACIGDSLAGPTSITKT